MSRGKNRWILIFLIGFIASMIILQFHSRKKGVELFIEFDKSKITGEIIKISSSTGTTYISVQMEGGVKEFGFWPYKNNTGLVFISYAVSGDSVFKESYSDTLFLKKERETTSFTFNSLDN